MKDIIAGIIPAAMIHLSDNSVKLLQRRYLLKDADGVVNETPEMLFRRVAKCIAATELCWGTPADAAIWEERFYNIMSQLLFLPNSPTLMNAGTLNNQLSACFVLPVNDTMDSIFTTLKNTALIQQSGGGTGFNFSNLRPKDDLVLKSGGTASGPVSFIKVFDAATEHIKQGGKRRGANMGILNISHPDIEAFIDAKRNRDVLNNFNISVGISDTFMHTLELNGEWSLVHPNSKAIVKKISAQKIWNAIVGSAWQTGDPGLIFMDTINRDNPTPDLGKIEATNPCGEVPLLPYEPCNLGSVNLSKFVVFNNGNDHINWQKLEEVIKTAIRFLDNVIEVNNYVIPEIAAMAKGNRKIGLGVMGWAELLLMQEIPYDSAAAIVLAEKIMQFIQQKSLEASAELARQRGPFLNWEKSVYFPGVVLRNATRTSIAPTGSISIIADTTSSIEPLFALAFQRQHVLNDETLFSVNQVVVNFLQAHHLLSDNILDALIKKGVAADVDALPVSVKNIFKTALEISPLWHLKHQLAFQKYTDNAVSKTINLPQTATRNEVDKIYKLAWLQQAKGITVFRNHSKGKQVMTAGIEYETDGCKVCAEKNIMPVDTIINSLH